MRLEAEIALSRINRRAHKGCSSMMKSKVRNEQSSR